MSDKLVTQIMIVISRCRYVTTFMIVALCVILAVSAAPILGQNSENSTLVSPCPEVFTYLPLGPDFDRWYGVINVTVDELPSRPEILIELDAGDWSEWKRLKTLEIPDNTTSEDSSSQSNPGFTELVYFSVKYDPRKITPRLKSIALHCMELCNINKSDGADTETDSNPKQSWPVASWCKYDIYDRGGAFIYAALRLLGSPRSTNSRSVGRQCQCGEVVSSALPAMNQITPTWKYQWPWQVALHHIGRKDGMLLILDYFCGGTLITARYVITAAQCVTEKSSIKLQEPFPMIFLGKHNLKSSVEGVQRRLTVDVFIHPKYDATTFSSDVAILELDKPLKYSNWVRPACLWRAEDNFKNFIGKTGLLLEWRFDSGNHVIEELSQEEMTIVNQETCKKSHNFFTRFTSNYTYCAENRDESSSCPSIGSGMVFRNGSTWYLRGLLSLSVPRQNRCDPTKYAVFTDLAKYLPWIESHVFDYR